MDSEEHLKQLRSELAALAARIEQVSAETRRALPPRLDDAPRIGGTWFDSAAWVLVVVGW